MNRLDLIAQLTANSNHLCDIGADHGYVCIKSVTKYNTLKATACDVNMLPLMNAKANIIKNNLEDKIDILLSDGLKEVNNDIDVCVISGMGGILISKILNDSIEKAKKIQKIILQPNTDVSYLREELYKNNFLFTDEKLVLDRNKYYHIIVGHFINSNVQFDIKDVLYGPILRKEKSENFVNYYTNKISNLKKNMINANDSNRITMDNEITLIQEMLNEAI
ncbi:MAG: tRNA (adenine(22)-N(1))-methyltransferase [Anaeroplasmataceae bacterium]